MSPSVAVVGGGIAGLAAAWTLVEHHGVEAVVLEASTRAGGKLRVDSLAGHPVDAGADAFLVRVPDAVDLCHELGLGDELVAPAARDAFLLHRGRLAPFPDGLVLGVPTDLDALSASGLVSGAGVARVRDDLAADREPLDGDVAVGPWVRSRIGDEVFETLVEPLLSGINAGDPDRLSLDAGAPQLAVAAHAGGSLVARLRAQREGADLDAPVFNSLAGGAGRLADVLAGRLGERLHLGTRVASIDRRGPRYTVVTEQAGARGAVDLDVDGVVVAVPAARAAPLVEAAPRASGELAALDYASVAVVTLAFPRDAVDHPLEGSGMLVPPDEGLVTTACSWGSSKWPHWADPDTVVLRASVGRHHRPGGLDLPDAELVVRVVDELRPALGLGAAPTEQRVTRWPDALPQYRPGHLERVASWEQELDRELPAVALAGAATRGLGIPACVASARRAAAHVVGAIGAA